METRPQTQRQRSQSAAPRLVAASTPVLTPRLEPIATTPPGTTPARGFCAPSTPLTGKPLDEEVAALIPDLAGGSKLLSQLHADVQSEAIQGILLPRQVASWNTGGICEHWRAATQDVDFERKLLLRELLASLPPGAIVLPSECPSLEEMDLAPLKVQPLLEAIGRRQRMDLNSATFRWDLPQPPPKLAWGGDEAQGEGSEAPLWAGLSKRQLHVAAFETLLLALRALEANSAAAAGDGSRGSGGRSGGGGDIDAVCGLDAAAREATVGCFASQLGISIQLARRLHVRNAKPSTRAHACAFCCSVFRCCALVSWVTDDMAARVGTMCMAGRSRACGRACYCRRHRAHRQQQQHEDDDSSLRAAAPPRAPTPHGAV